MSLVGKLGEANGGGNAWDCKRKTGVLRLKFQGNGGYEELIKSLCMRDINMKEQIFRPFPFERLTERGPSRCILDRPS